MILTWRGHENAECREWSGPDSSITVKKQFKNVDMKIKETILCFFATTSSF